MVVKLLVLNIILANDRISGGESRFSFLFIFRCKEHVETSGYTTGEWLQERFSPAGKTVGDASVKLSGEVISGELCPIE